MQSKLVPLTCAVAILTVIAATTPEAQRARDWRGAGGSELEITVQQLPEENGVTPAELRCETARLSSPSSIEGTTCVVSNNTNKRISAVTLAYLVVTEKDGKEAPDISYLTIDTIIHPDLLAGRADKRIPPRGKLPVRDMSMTYDAVIKGIKVWIDYLEFDDRSAAGQNNAGSRIVTDIRSGAARYKAWLARQYELSEKSSGALVRLLENDPSPEELGIKNDHEEQGMTFYKDYARKVVKERGAAALAERLDSTPAARNR